MRNHIQHLGFALVLYVVTALVHYTPYSPGRGRLTITNSMPHILVMLVAGLKIILCVWHTYLFLLLVSLSITVRTLVHFGILKARMESVCGANYYNTMTCDKNCVLTAWQLYYLEQLH